MNGELTEIFVIYHRKLSAMAYKSNQIPRTGDILHFPHFGGFRVKNVVYRIADDSGLDGNRLMWVELFVEKYEEIKHEERKCEDCDYSEPIFEEVKSDDRIKVGDEVEIYGTGSHGVVTSIAKFNNKYYYRCVKYNGDLCTENDDFPPKKTGRHFPQIAEVLRQMQEGASE